VLYDWSVAEVLASRLTGRPGPGTALRWVGVGRASLGLGELDARYLCFDRIELIRRLFVAVRDIDWGTAPASVEHVEVDFGPRELRSTMTAVARDPGRQIELRWHGALQCREDGSVRYEFEGTALRAFVYARIGICVLHPPSFAGGSYRAKTAAGWIRGSLEHAIAPQLPGEHGFGEPLFPAFDELELRRPDGVGVRLHLSGDLFELEDQRNWADASYKTYSTPLRLGPQPAALGQVISQRVEITPIDPPPRRPTREPQPLTVELATPTSHPVPAIGVVLADHARPLATRELQLLNGLRLGHVRVDLDLTGRSWRERLEDAVLDSAELDTPLELAITVGADSRPVGALSEALRLSEACIARVLVFRAGSPVTPPDAVVTVRHHLAETGVTAPVYGGTNTLFADLNGNRPESDELDGVAFPVVPTMHADDDLSLVETMSVFSDIVRTARTFCADLPLAVSPIALRERPASDERQSSLLGAVWTLGAASAMAAAGTASATFYEAIGARGVLDVSEAGVFPVYHVLADLCSWSGGRVVLTRSSDVLSVGSLAVRLPDGRLSGVVVNALPRHSRVRLAGFPDCSFRVRRLNEAEFDLATREPMRFREQGERASAPELELAPYEIVRLDAET
jgi:hypothetical protein